MFLGIDIGGTTTKIGLLNDQWKLIEEKQVPTKRDYLEAVAEIDQIVKDYQKSYPIESIGVGMTGVINPQEGKVELCFSLPDWTGKMLAEDLEKRTGLKVVVENDAVAAAVAEMVMGSGKGINQLIYIIWGTGVGGAVIKRVKEGMVVFPMEMGSQIVEWEGKQGKSGPRGRLSTYVGGGEFENIWGKSPIDLDENDQIWWQVAHRMAQGIINTLVHFPAQKVVFGGGFASKQQHLMGKIEQSIGERLRITQVPNLVLSTFGEKNGVLGAAVLPSQDLSR